MVMKQVNGYFVGIFNVFTTMKDNKKSNQNIEEVLFWECFIVSNMNSVSYFVEPQHPTHVNVFAKYLYPTFVFAIILQF